MALFFEYLNWFTNLFISGKYNYFFGPYPKAGILHLLYLLMTSVEVMVGLYVLWYAMQNYGFDRKKKAQVYLVLISLIFYSLAGSDFLCNWGFTVAFIVLINKMMGRLMMEGFGDKIPRIFSKPPLL